MYPDAAPKPYGMPLEYSNVGVGNAGTSSRYSHLYHQQFYDDVSFPREPLENNAGREDTLTQLQDEWWMLHHTAGSTTTIDGVTNQ